MSDRLKELGTKSDQALEQIFQWVLKSDAPVVEVSSPPGGGKSTLLNHLGIFIAVKQTITVKSGQRPPRLIMITQSHPQTVSLVEGLLKGGSGLPLKIIGAAGESKSWPAAIRTHPQFTQMSKGKMGIADLMGDSGDDGEKESDLPFILVTNGSKAQDLTLRYSELHQWFDYGFVDEAYQMRYGDFLFAIDLARRWIPVGDPGQLDPVKTEPPYDLAHVAYGARPYLPMPQGLEEDGIEVQRIPLPVSWRLPQDTVEIIQPAFYRNLVFEGAGEATRRRLLLKPARYGDTLDRALDALAEEGKSLQMLTLPAQPPTTEIDIELHRQAVEIIKRLLERDAYIEDRDNGTDKRKVTPRDILVLASRVNQVADLQAQIQLIQHSVPLNAEVIATEQFQPEAGDTGDAFDTTTFTDEQELLQTMIVRMTESNDRALVDTANRLQGLEAPLVVAIHPCSGLESLTDFDLEIGRLCVMLSRHRIGCLLVSRASVRELLSQPYLSTDRALENDPAEDVHEGLLAHRRLLDELRQKKRIW